MRERGELDIPEEIHLPAVSSDTTATCKNSGVNQSSGNRTRFALGRGESSRNNANRCLHGKMIHQLDEMPITNAAMVTIVRGMEKEIKIVLGGQASPYPDWLDHFNIILLLSPE
ncbi:hypothetical protein PR048_021231 [Dryococelus australis]|uniref:Uncharacterized protein n=1 Tax=Dryococelus australis TaxID=614101 RepID=A0ABQ9GXM8_9NEOP|nr:hypothetical protein PR048_021231 [Dryococelus australis]